MKREKNLLAEIVIPQFITHIQISKKRRKRYYRRGMKIPPTYKKKYKFNKNGYLVNDNGQKIVANPRSAGKPNLMPLSGNRLIIASNPVRINMTRHLKKFFKPFVADYVNKHGMIEQYPLKVTWDVYTTVNPKLPNWDISNMFFYYKYFEDCLFDEPKLIHDDNIRYITWSGGIKLHPIDRWEDRKFVFKFYHDRRKELQRPPWRVQE